jgi:hypothetical protein
MSPGLAQRLDNLYACTHRGLWINEDYAPGERFLMIIGEVIGAEFRNGGYAQYKPPILDDFLEKETHYVLIDSGFKWQRGAFEGLKGERYGEIKDIVSYAFVENAICVLDGRNSNIDLLDSLRVRARKLLDSAHESNRIGLTMRCVDEGDFALSSKKDKEDKKACACAR